MRSHVGANDWDTVSRAYLQLLNCSEMLIYRVAQNKPDYLGRPTLVGKALSYTHELSFFYQSTVLSSHAVDGHQMYFGGSVVVKRQQLVERSRPSLP